MLSNALFAKIDWVVNGNAEFSIRVGSQQNSLSIAHKLAAYFFLEVTPNFTNNMRSICSEHKLWIRKVLLMKNKRDA